MTLDEFWELTDPGEDRTALLRTGIGGEAWLYGTFQQFVAAGARFVTFTGTVVERTEGDSIWMDRWDVPVDMIAAVL